MESYAETLRERAPNTPFRSHGPRATSVTSSPVPASSRELRSTRTSSPEPTASRCSPVCSRGPATSRWTPSSAAASPSRTQVASTLRARRAGDRQRVDLCPPAPRGWRRKQNREWRHFQSGELADSTVTIVGLGSIGQAIAHRLEGSRSTPSASAIRPRRAARPTRCSASTRPTSTTHSPEASTSCSRAR